MMAKEINLHMKQNYYNVCLIHFFALRRKYPENTIFICLSFIHS